MSKYSEINKKILEDLRNKGQESLKKLARKFKGSESEFIAAVCFKKPENRAAAAREFLRNLPGKSRRRVNPNNENSASRRLF
ncbi:hypothetical protein OAT84_00790 [Gammaproteobacteria bacterium]|nr:hypothetical protein [Gammaproteobacteria bacterium]